MLETISLMLATPIAKIILDKLYESVGSKLGEKAVGAASAPIQKLGQAVWNRCFKGKPGTDQVLEAAAKGSEPELKQIRDYLWQEMEDPEFVSMVQPLAQEIHQVIVQFDDVNARNSMQVSGGEGFQNNDSQAPILQGVHNSPININYNYGNNPNG
jgi:hypothetical protein